MKDLEKTLGLFFWTIFLLTIATLEVKAVENQSLTFFQHGRDADGIIVYDRIEIFPDRHVTWQTASKGSAHCPNEAGTFKGIVTQETFKQIMTLGLAVEQDKGVVNSQPKFRSSRSVSSSLTLESAGKIRVVQVQEFTPSVEALHEELAYLRGTLIPNTGVRMQATKKNNGVQITFTHLGNQPFRLLIPKMAEEAFFLPSKSKINFATPTKNRNILLSSHLNSVSYQILTPHLSEAQRKAKNFIFYSGATLAHHGDASVASGGNLPKAQEIALCAEF